MDWKLLLIGLLQGVLVLLLAPLFTGFSRLLRAKMHNRQGPPLWQNYYDMFKLFTREEVRPEVTARLFRFTPYLMIAITFLIAMLLPLLTLNSPLGGVGDGILVIYLLAMLKFFLANAGLESGSTFSGLGSIREMSLSVLVEPTIVLVLFVLALFVHSTDLGRISAYCARGTVYGTPATWLALTALAITTFIELGKLPFDLSEAEQELQEGPLTEYSGKSLALATWGLAMKQMVVASLFLAIFVPFGNSAALTWTGLLLGLLFYLLKLTVCYLITAVVENSMARLTIYQAPSLTWLGFGIALLSLVFYLVHLLSEVNG